MVLDYLVVRFALGILTKELAKIEAKNRNTDEKRGEKGKNKRRSERKNAKTLVR